MVCRCGVLILIIYNLKIKLNSFSNPQNIIATLREETFLTNDLIQIQ